MALYLQTWIFPKLFKLITELKKCRKEDKSEMGDKKQNGF